MSTHTIGRIEEFYHWSDWTVYYERLEQFFEVNNIPEEKRVGVLISVIGSYTYKILRDLCHPTLPKEKTFDELCELMRRNFCPQVSIFRERITFYRVVQEPRECITSWYRRIKSLSVDCKFGENLEVILLDRFITGLRSGPILDRLCEEKETITLQQAMEIALNKEASLESGGDEVPQPIACMTAVDEVDSDKNENECTSDSGHGTVIECNLDRDKEIPICNKPFQEPVRDHEVQICPIPNNVNEGIDQIMCTVGDQGLFGGAAPPPPPPEAPITCMRKTLAPQPKQRNLVPEPIEEQAEMIESVPMMTAMVPLASTARAVDVPIQAMMPPAAAPLRTTQRARKRGCRGGQRRNRNNQNQNQN